MNTELSTPKTELDMMKALLEQTTRTTRRARLLGGLGMTALIGAVALAGRQPVGAQGGYGPTLAGLQAQIVALNAKTQFMATDAFARTTTFTGCNVQIQNGLGATNGVPGSVGDYSASNVNGLGNLIIGYNALQGNGQDTRTGSHNMVIGGYCTGVPVSANDLGLPSY